MEESVNLKGQLLLKERHSQGLAWKNERKEKVKGLLVGKGKAKKTGRKKTYKVDT